MAEELLLCGLNSLTLKNGLHGTIYLSIRLPVPQSIKNLSQYSQSRLPFDFHALLPPRYSIVHQSLECVSYTIVLVNSLNRHVHFYSV